jgi:hypothetical protein
MAHLNLKLEYLRMKEQSPFSAIEDIVEMRKSSKLGGTLVSG